MESIEKILSRVPGDDHIRRRIMRRVYGAYVMSIITDSGFVHGITLSVAGGSLYSMTTPSAIMKHMLNVKVGELPGYVTHVIMNAPVLKTVLLGLFIGTASWGLMRLMKYMRSVRMPQISILRIRT